MSDKKKRSKKRPDALKPAPAAAPQPEAKVPEVPAEQEPEKTEPVKAEPAKTAESKPAAAKPAEPKKKKGMLNLIENVILVFGFMLMFASILPDIRNSVAHSIDVIVSPFTSAMPFFIVVLAIATIVTVFSTFLQKYLVDWEMMRMVTMKNRALSKEMREAQLAGNKAKLKKLQEEQLAGMEEQNRVSMQQFKPTGFLAIISVPLFIWAWWYLSQHSTLTMVFPLTGSVVLSQGAFFIFPWWMLWSLLCSFALSQVVRKALNVGIPT